MLVYEVGLFARRWMELGIMILSQKADVVSHMLVSRFYMNL